MCVLKKPWLSVAAPVPLWAQPQVMATPRLSEPPSIPGAPQLARRAPTAGSWARFSASVQESAPSAPRGCCGQLGGGPAPSPLCEGDETSRGSPPCSPCRPAASQPRGLSAAQLHGGAGRKRKFSLTPPQRHPGDGACATCSRVPARLFPHRGAAVGTQKYFSTTFRHCFPSPSARAAARVSQEVYGEVTRTWVDGSPPSPQPRNPAKDCVNQKKYVLLLMQC